MNFNKINKNENIFITIKKECWYLHPTKNRRELIRTTVNNNSLESIIFKNIPI